MNRDVVLATLALVLGGAGLSLSSWLPPRAAPTSAEIGGLTLERRAWRRVWLPLVPAALALATLIGWALQEPGETDELLRPFAAVLAVPISLVWARAALRAVLALRRPRTLPPFATLGLVRPRLVVGPGVEGVLDPAALGAAVAHERAHVAHRDPLRIWLAQLATDAQWPNPKARARLDQWLSTLELARDDEARRAGARGEDLAAAVVAIAGLARGERAPAVARLTGAELALASRVHRLLVPLRGEPERHALAGPLAVLVSLAAAIVIGLEFGDSLLRALPLIRT